MARARCIIPAESGPCEARPPDRFDPGDARERSAADRGTGTEAAFAPSEYTGLLIGALHRLTGGLAGATVLEIGTGSGVVLAAAARLGAHSVTGVEVEPAAVDATRAVLDRLGVVHDIHCGSMWSPVAGRRFDVIVANLPQFPMMDAGGTGQRRPSWSYGGPDGRLLLDAFVGQAAHHLARPGGRALVTHNGFADLPATVARAGAAGLTARVASTTLVPIPADKAAVLAPAARQRHADSLHQFGPYLFGDVHVVELSWT